MTKLRSLIARTVRSFVNHLTEISYLRLGVLYALMVASFGCVYFALATLTVTHGPSIGGGPWFVRLFNSFYFSIITAASVGYGDIYPHGVSKVIASVESVLSLFVFAILVSKPISERQEAALYQMHKLTLDEIFTSIREGFFIMRKDFDAMIAAVETTHSCSEHDRENFEIALQQGQVLIDDIPTFYDTEKQLYVIDLRREKLLAEAVERTFDRLLRTVRTLRNHQIVLSDRTKLILGELLTASENTLKKWRRHSSKAVHPLIDTSMKILGEIETMG